MDIQERDKKPLAMAAGIIFVTIISIMAFLFFGGTILFFLVGVAALAIAAYLFYNITLHEKEFGVKTARKSARKQKGNALE